MNNENDISSSGRRGPLPLTHIPSKFCPFCGHKNDASNDICENCGKDISWIKIPEPTPYVSTPKEKPRSLPKGEPVFTRKAIVIAVLIIFMLVGLILAVIFLGKSETSKPETGVETVLVLNINTTQPLSCGSQPWEKPTQCGA